MEVIRGVDILISVGEEAVAAQRGATLNRSADVIDVSNKVSGDWKKNISGMKEWSLDCDGLLPINNAGYMALEAAFNEGTEVTVKLAKGVELVYTGNAYITDFPIEAPYDDIATYSVSLTGSGALVKA